MGRPPHDCYICGSPTHIAKQCKQESSSNSKNNTDDKNTTDNKKTKCPVDAVHLVNQSNNPLGFLESDSDGSTISVVCI